MADRIAIVRMAAAGALGEDLAAIVCSLRSAAGGVRQSVALEQSPANQAGVGEVPLETPDPCIPHRAEVLLERCLHQLLGDDPASAIAAVPDRCGVVVGTTLAGMRHCGHAMRMLGRGDRQSAARAFRSMPAGQVLRKVLARYPIRGCATSVSCACASALSAVASGCALLQAGDADAVVVGGYDPIAEFSYAGFASLQLVAKGPLSPFAADREGMKLGEGVALFLMRPLAAALRLGETPIAVIEGIGEASDAFHLTRPHPEGRGAGTALAAACGDAPVDLILAHATGTPDNDGCEYSAYRSTFGARLPSMPVTALKSRFGHPLGAAGALELAVALACALDGFVPAGIGNPPDTNTFTDLDLVHMAPRRHSPRRLVALSAGFGGANVAIAVNREPLLHGEPGVAGEESHGVVISAIGAVTGGGRGLEGIRAMLGTPGSDVSEELIASMVDRVRTRRLAVLPKLLIAATRDLLDSAGMAYSSLLDVPTLVATWHGATGFTERYYADLISSGIDLANPMLFAESVPNVGSAHVSIAYGVQAASASVIGTRTSGLEALHLARARIKSGMWRQALVLAAEETHPLVDSVLSDLFRTPVHGCSASVALLLRRSDDADAVALVSTGVGATPGGLGTVSSGSALDQRSNPQGEELVMLPEMGSCTGLALVALAAGRPQPGRLVVSSSEPMGSRWWAEVGHREVCR